jgi:Putative motility protein
MDGLTAAISNFQQAKTISNVQMAVAKKVLDTQKSQGNSAVQMIKAATTGFTEAGDQMVAAATGLGGEIDTYG